MRTTRPDFATRELERLRTELDEMRHSLFEMQLGGLLMACIVLAFRLWLGDVPTSVLGGLLGSVGVSATISGLRRRGLRRRLARERAADGP